MSDRGLGGNWLDRQAAEASMYQSRSTSSDQDEQQASSHASEDARKFASIHASKSEESQTVQATTEPPPPPPARPKEMRVQFNHRILSDRDEVLQRYKQEHNTTMQAIVDQMVDEYLHRRGLLLPEQ